MDDELADYDFALSISKAVLKIQQDVEIIKQQTKSSNTLISSNIKFFEGLGDIGNLMSQILSDVTAKYDGLITDYSNIVQAGVHVLQNTSSINYPTMTIMQEWLLELNAVVISLTSKWAQEDAKEWLIRRHMDLIKPGETSQRIPTTDDFFRTEEEFQYIQTNMKVSDFTMITLRLGYLIYVGLLLNIPFTQYPHFGNLEHHIEEVNKQLKQE